MTKLKPFIGRIGGKAKIAKFIVEQFKQFDYSIYCESFLGSGAIYFELINSKIPDLINARKKHFRAVLNDADKAIINLFETVRDNPFELAFDVHFTPYSRKEHKSSKHY
jgi:DNA adenine methylase